MFGKTKKLIADLNKEIFDLKVTVRDFKAKNHKLIETNDELHKIIAEAHKKHAEYAAEIEKLKCFKEAFEGSVAGLGSLLEEESLVHKRQTEYMRGLKAAKSVMEVYTSADESNT